MNLTVNCVAVVLVTDNVISVFLIVVVVVMVIVVVFLPTLCFTT